MTARSDQFLARVDRTLDVLGSDDVRREFLVEQIDGWTTRYARFVASSGESEPCTDRNDPPHCADFLLVIIGLAARRDMLGASS